MIISNSLDCHDNIPKVIKWVKNITNIPLALKNFCDNSVEHVCI